MAPRILLPVFSSCLAVVFAQPLPPLRLKAGAAPPNLMDAAEHKQRAAARSRAAAGRLHWLVQFPAEPDAELLDRLGWLDVRVLEYVPDQALLVSAPAATDWSAAGAIYASLLTAAEKLSPALPAQGEAVAVAELHRDAARGDGAAAALAAGLEVLEHPDLAPHALLVRGPVEALRRLAEADEVAYVYPAAAALRDGEPVVACLGGLMGPAALSGANLATTFGDGWDGPGLGAASLAVYFGTLPSSVDRSAAISEIRRAMAEWAAHVQLTFTDSGAARLRRQIEILAAAREHGDGFAFDGRGGVLAHTFYPPPNPETLAGDLHLDLDEPWKLGADVDLFSVALHELGHALGLGHNDDPSSVMYPYYRRVSGLAAADIAEIRKLYAARTPSSSTPATPSSPSNPSTPSTPPSSPPSSPSNPPAPPADDRTPPTLAITFPYSASYATSAATITVRGAATDNVAVTQVLWSTRDASGTAQGAPSAFAAGPIPLARGFNTVTITAADAAGNITRRNLSITRY
ncbi:MAG: matrixin family metalloprotease [Bryobacteraceae bacterium]|nr:matrixin family metalloprotease [Bryobacteraceae bacterium]